MVPSIKVLIYKKSISTYVKRNLRTLNFSLFRRKCNFLYKYFKYYPLSPFISITCNKCFVFILLMIAHRCNSTSYLKRTSYINIMISKYWSAQGLVPIFKPLKSPKKWKAWRKLNRYQSRSPTLLYLYNIVERGLVLRHQHHRGEARAFIEPVG